MAGGGDEEQAAVDASVLDEAVAHGSQLLAKEGRVLVLDVLDDGLPAIEKIRLCECPSSHMFASSCFKFCRDSKRRRLQKSNQCLAPYQFSLLTWSPYPGVSTMLSFSLTPFSTTATGRKTRQLG